MWFFFDVLFSFVLFFPDLDSFGLGVVGTLRWKICRGCFVSSPKYPRDWTQFPTYLSRLEISLYTSLLLFFGLKGYYVLKQSHVQFSNYFLFKVILFFIVYAACHC